jgi:hypothetical protein
MQGLRAPIHQSNGRPLVEARPATSKSPRCDQRIRMPRCSIDARTRGHVRLEAVCLLRHPDFRLCGGMSGGGRQRRLQISRNVSVDRTGTIRRLPSKCATDEPKAQHRQYA